MESPPEAIIFDIKRYSIHDGPGIRTTAFLKGCPIRCRWCANPESQKRSPEIAYFKQECIQCRKCLETCPLNAIHFSGAAHCLDRSVCDLCAQCVDVCPADALQIVGRTVTARGLFDEMVSDRPFWERSGGGVTLSGGEPLIQHQFVKAFLELCRSNYIHTAIETCLHISPKILKDILPLVDFVICDMKIMDSEKHKQFTAVSNKLILENIVFLLNSDLDMLVRMPLIPGVNDDVANLEALGAFLQSHRKNAQLELLPFHRLGESKYEQAGRTIEMKNVLPPSKEEMQKAAARLNAFNLEVVMEH
ncbi:MAG: glycyl-radical enzyme activating protein [Chloroflexi bacterium]|nr:MAG: glycyl-radical enzyme activating protein [Chloroflexota bacterium]